MCVVVVLCVVGDRIVHPPQRCMSVCVHVPSYVCLHVFCCVRVGVLQKGEAACKCRVHSLVAMQVHTR